MCFWWIFRVGKYSEIIIFHHKTVSTLDIQHVNPKIIKQQRDLCDSFGHSLIRLLLSVSCAVGIPWGVANSDEGQSFLSGSLQASEPVSCIITTLCLTNYMSALEAKSVVQAHSNQPGCMGSIGLLGGGDVWVEFKRKKKNYPGKKKMIGWREAFR